MKIIEVSGAAIPALGLGTFKLEGEAGRRIVADAIDVGYRHIDTARMYGNEREVGQGIADSGIDRSELFVTTKIWPSDIGADTLVPTAEAALEALGLEAVDLLLIHWPNPSIPLEESIGALNRAKAGGLAHHIGVANFTSVMLDEAAAISEAPLVCNQVEYHPMLSQEAVLAACRRHDMAMVAYSPIARGELLADQRIVRMAEHHGKSPAQIVLRWEIDQDGVAAIPRTSNPERLRSNFDLFGFELEDEERAVLNEMTKQRRRLVNPSSGPNWDRI